ncbi:hypothetical protein CL619_02265 [archaeon]|nr:hypothetical protein [archaeon]|tara:strand:- start:2884 stop:3093 length:210 start_codon:yes stop_codon:yes gene_type:complete
MGDTKELLRRVGQIFDRGLHKLTTFDQGPVGFYDYDTFVPLEQGSTNGWPISYFGSRSPINSKKVSYNR